MNIDFLKKRTLNLDRELMMFDLPLKQLLDKIDDPEKSMIFCETLYVAIW